VKKKRFIYWFVLAVLIVVNGFILMHRNEEYKYFPYKSYSEIYVTDSMLYLKDLHFSNDSVALVLSKNMEINGKTKLWQVFVDSQNIGFANAFSNTINVPLINGIHNYRLNSIASNKNILFTIDHNLDDSASKKYTNEFMYINMPGPNINVSHQKQWQSDIGFTADEKLQANNLLKEKTKFHCDSSDTYNTFAISKFVATLCNNPKGIDFNTLSRLRPIGQLNEAMKCNASMACGNYAAMMGYLFSVAKIPNRVVFFQSRSVNWQYGVHYYNEIFLRDKQKWVLVDAANNITMPYLSKFGDFLNAADIKKLIQLNHTSSIEAFVFKNDSTITTIYDSINKPHFYYHQSNANLCYYHANADVSNSKFRSILEFYTFNRDVDFYSDVNRNNWFKIVIKEFAMLLLLLTFLFYFVFEFSNRQHKQKA
jgi:hypothetical protein